MPAKELDDVKATARRIATDKINATKAIEACPMPDSLVERLRENWKAWGSPTDRYNCMNESCMAMDCKEAADVLERQSAELAALREQVARLESKLNSPELVNFADAVVRESAHQRERWGSEHDAGKTPQDWFWLLGYLAGKALHAAKAGDTDKTLHHTISSAAALANWHAATLGVSNTMRPGIDPVARGVAIAQQQGTPE